MTKLIKGVFISDIHMPDNINLAPVLKFLGDFKPDVIILGGDIIDAKGMHGCESMQAGQIDMAWYKRDCRLITKLLVDITDRVADAKYIYLEGNHEERYARVMRKYPKVFKGQFNFLRDTALQELGCKWIAYGSQRSYYRIGDCLFIHGVKYPDAHAKMYAKEYTPYKVVYGHLHHYQAYTTHRPLQGLSPRYALTAGCLSKTNPEWKKGVPNQWLNGFVSFMSDGRTTVPTVHLIEKGKFYIGDKCYDWR